MGCFGIENGRDGTTRGIVQFAISAGRARKQYGHLADHQKDFLKMLDEAKLDVLVVTTVDATHHEFIVPALKKGIRVLTEKPMTT